MLNRVNFPLTGAQVGDFILDREYTNFLTLQKAISELSDSGLITADSIHNRTHLIITPEGRSTLLFFENRISPSIKKEINDFFKEKELDLRNEVSILADYYKATSGDFEARLIAKEKNTKLLEIILSVPSKESAAAICDNWQLRNQEIYQYLIEKLF